MYYDFFYKLFFQVDFYKKKWHLIFKIDFKIKTEYAPSTPEMGIEGL